MPLHILLITVGSGKDIHPFTAIGQALLALGCRVTRVANPYYESTIVGAGIFTRETSIVRHHNGFDELAAAPCKSLGLGVVVGVNVANAPKRLPRMARAFDDAPYRAAFPAASVIIRHGSAGTTAAAMMQGKPTMIVPFVNDELNNATMAERLRPSVTLRAGGLRDVGCSL